LSRVHLGIEKIPISTFIGRGRPARHMGEVAIPLVAGYCGEDVHCTWLLAERFRPQIEARDAARLLAEVEMPLVTVLKDMEKEGVLVDRAFLARMSQSLESEMMRLEGSSTPPPAAPSNINSGPQLAEILFRRLGLPARKQTKSGLSTDAFVLEELAVLHELPRLILQYRQVSKLKSTYVDAIPALQHPETGRGAHGVSPDGGGDGAAVDLQSGLAEHSHAQRARPRGAQGVRGARRVAAHRRRLLADRAARHGRTCRATRRSTRRSRRASTCTATPRPRSSASRTARPRRRSAPRPRS
jgi:hypothetical protein